LLNYHQEFHFYQPMWPHNINQKDRMQINFFCSYVFGTLSRGSFDIACLFFSLLNCLALRNLGQLALAKGMTWCCLNISHLTLWWELHQTLACLFLCPLCAYLDFLLASMLFIYYKIAFIRNNRKNDFRYPLKFECLLLFLNLKLRNFFNWNFLKFSFMIRCFLNKYYFHLEIKIYLNTSLLIIKANLGLFIAILTSKSV